MPHVGLWRLLQDPSKVLYLYDGSQAGASMKQVSEMLEGRAEFVDGKSKDLKERFL